MINSSVQGSALPNSFTVGEIVQIHFEMRIPVSTNRNFVFVIGDQDVKVLNGLLTKAGKNIKADEKHLQGKGIAEKFMFIILQISKVLHSYEAR